MEPGHAYLAQLIRPRARDARNNGTIHPRLDCKAKQNSSIPFTQSFKVIFCAANYVTAITPSINDLYKAGFKSVLLIRLSF